MENQIEKQAIEEMAKYIYGNGITHDTAFHEDCRSIAIDLYNAGYRKQSKNIVELSCKVGDLVYETYGNRIFEYVITSIEISSPYEIVYKVQSTQPWNRFIRFIGFTKQNIGKTIFLTREEAEKVKMKGGAE